MAKKPGTPSAADKEALINAAYKFFTDKGLSPIGASYLIGSILQESNFDPSAVEKLKGGKIGKGRGLVEWSEGAGSMAALRKWASDHGLPWNDFTTQMYFAINQNTDVTEELKNAAPDPPPKGGGVSTTSASAKTAIKHLENYGTEGNRFQYAPQIYSNVLNKRPPGAGLGGLVSDQLDDIPGMIEDLQGKFMEQPPNTYCAACNPPKGVQMNVSASIIPKNPAPPSGTPGQ